jgi:hypothetical protein
MLCGGCLGSIGRRWWSEGVLVGGFVVAGVAAGLAIHEAVFADADVELRTAEDAELITLAMVFRHLALAATKFGGAGSVGHSNNVARGGGVGNVPLVTWNIHC